MTVSFIILVCVPFPFPDVPFHCGWQSISFSMPFCLLAMSEKFFNEQDAPWPFWDRQRYLCARSKFNNTTQLGFPPRLFQAILQRLDYKERSSICHTNTQIPRLNSSLLQTHTVKDSQIHEGPWGMWAKTSRTQAPTVFWPFGGDFECLPAPKVSSGTHIQNGRAEFSANNKKYTVLAE